MGESQNLTPRRISMRKLRPCKLLSLISAGNQKVSSLGKLNGYRRACAVSILFVVTTIALPARTFTTLHSFNGTDGANSYTGFVQGADGDFYGTTIDGGANAGGNIFKITPSGKLTPLYSFCSQSNCTDGQYPVTVLVPGADGNLYGTTQSGGTSGNGTIFRISTKGKLTTLHS